MQYFTTDPEWNLEAHEEYQSSYGRSTPSPHPIDAIAKVQAPEGHLYLIIGPMFAGKSIELMRQLLRRRGGIGSHCLRIKHVADVRPDETHASPDIKYPREIESILTSTLSEVDVSAYDVIGVDESQFFSDLSPILDWVNRLGKDVFCAGLTGDSKKKKFGDISSLIPEADDVLMLKADCRLCKQEDGILKPAIFSHSLKSIETQQHVGGKESYISLCRRHFNKLNAV